MRFLGYVGVHALDSAQHTGDLGATQLPPSLETGQLLAANTIASLTNSRNLTPGTGQGVAPWRVYKAANESVLNSITLQDDDALVAAVEANASYRVVAHIRYTGPVANPLTWRFTAPAGAVLQGNVIWATGVTTYVVDIGVDALASQSSQCNGVGAGRYMRFEGILRMGGAAGNLQFQFAQQVADAVNAHTVYAGSELEIQRQA